MYVSDLFYIPNYCDKLKLLNLHNSIWVHLVYDDVKKLPYRHISPVLFVLSLSHDGTPSLLRSITKITWRYATSALTNIGELGLKNFSAAGHVINHYNHYISLTDEETDY